VKIRDRNHRTWCTIEHFFNMFEAIYEVMVDCGVAKKLDREFMRDKEGNEVDDPKKCTVDHQDII
jgi:hypothetical protein